METPKSDLSTTRLHLPRQLPLSTKPLIEGKVFTQSPVIIWIDHDYHTRPDLYRDGTISITE
jgi:hypothetical protein